MKGTTNGVKWETRVEGERVSVTVNRSRLGVVRSEIPALIAALKAAQRGNRAGVFGYRVVDNDGYYAERDVNASYGWDYKPLRAKPAPVSRAKAIDLLHRCRDWATNHGVETFRLVRVTQRARP